MSEDRTLDEQLLDGLAAIVAFLGRGWSAKRVRSLVRAGAPIVVTGEERGRRYVAVRDELEAWMRGRRPSAAING